MFDGGTRNIPLGHPMAGLVYVGASFFGVVTPLFVVFKKPQERPIFFGGGPRLKETSHPCCMGCCWSLDGLFRPVGPGGEPWFPIAGILNQRARVELLFLKINGHRPF